MGSVRRRALSRWSATALLITAAGGAAGAVAGAQGGVQGTPTATTPAAQTAKTVTLTAPQNLKRNLGEHRDTRTVEVLLDASDTLSNPPAVALDDVQTSDGTLFDGTVSATAELIGGKTVRVPIVIDPAAKAATGTYDVSVRLRGPEIANQDFKLKVELERSPHGFVAWLLALGALAFGLLLGGALKWFAERGTQLHDLLQRNAVLTRTLADAGRLPRSLQRSLLQVRLMLAQGNIPGVEAELTALEGDMTKLLPALDALARTTASVAAQEPRILAMGADSALSLRLGRVLGVERQNIDEAIDAAWPAPDDSKAVRAALATDIGGFTAFLERYREPASREGTNAASFDQALRAYESGTFKDAHDIWHPPVAGAPDSGAAPFAEQQIDLPQASSLSKLQWWLAMRAPGAVGILTAIVLALVGLFTVFKPDTMFLTDDAQDILLLVLWGFGTALTGVTVTQLAAKATSAVTPA